MGTRILAVDDSTSIREMLLRTLREAGYDVDEAEDGPRALTLARRHRFDLVLTDVNMPEMDGIALVRTLRETPEYRFTPMVIITTESGADFKQRGREAGATGWIVKPFHPDRLLAVVRKVLG